ncbi:methyl-accepting chemotaxis protein [Azospirillum doebereinerae]|uniref:PAS domain-containing methyl-accepting chemotaxis protein n=1 Tax=Azospirillum doebereinerae TaxID=92933 RepID=A0A433J623_9PROT|nr:PAS domain-containing protein [Azospirillum doebereinerae]MCG5238238.1 PAS domain-containing protein [Azospirillum doebereinerae]RUQ68163.1 PAS domain-containing methyl-accepting chemotaxis protein [Azospirillum doebereinerae]
MLSFRKVQDTRPNEEMALLGRYAGVGLWDAVIHNGDPMHPQSRWRWSQEFRRLVGFDREDTAGFPDRVGSWADRLHPDDAQPTFDAFGACLNDRSGRTGYNVDYRLKMKDGNYRWFRAIGGVARDASGLALRACGSLIDIDSERNELERAKLLDRFSGVGLWDAVIHNGDPMHARSHWRWSPEIRRLIGFDPNDMVGFPDLVGSWADRLHPDDAQPTFDAFGACLNDRSGRTGYDVVYRLRMRDGGFRWFRAIGGVARDANGLALRVCGSLIDIDAQKQAEVRQTEAEGERRQMVSALAQSLDSEVATAADRATANAQTVAAATEELSASITDISARATEASGASAKASDETTRTNAAVEALVNSAERIGAITKLINSIASQTNLLALNATIEAARAGEAGRGFAVVANEVKSLAQQSGSAADDIAAQIAAVQQEALHAVDAIRRIGTIVADVQQISMTIATAVSQQESATKEIAVSVTRVVRDIEVVSHSITSTSERLRR